MVTNWNLHTTAITCVALVSVFALHTDAQAPVPAALKSAKTVYLVNGAADVKALDELARHLRQWKGLTLVDAEDGADIVVTLGHATSGDGGVVPVGGVLLTYSSEAWMLTIKDRTTGAQLHADREDIGDFSRYGGLKNLVDRWRKRATGK